MNAPVQLVKKLDGFDSKAPWILGTIGASPFEQVIHMTVELHKLIDAGLGESHEADAIRDEIDPLLRRLTASEIHTATRVSAAIQKRRAAT